MKNNKILSISIVVVIICYLILQIILAYNKNVAAKDNIGPITHSIPEVQGKFLHPELLKNITNCEVYNIKYRNPILVGDYLRHRITILDFGNIGSMMLNKLLYFTVGNQGKTIGVPYYIIDAGPYLTMYTITSKQRSTEEIRLRVQSYPRTIVDRDTIKVFDIESESISINISNNESEDLYIENNLHAKKISTRVYFAKKNNNLLMAIVRPNHPMDSATIDWMHIFK